MTLTNESPAELVRSLLLVPGASARMLDRAGEGGADVVVLVWDSPWFAFRDPDGLRAHARAAALMGFDGMLAIHPAQIPVIHEAFAPSAEEARHARRVLAAAAAAEARGQAVGVLDGELVEPLHARAARRLLARYRDG